jgi:hypothetical protein
MKTVFTLLLSVLSAWSQADYTTLLALDSPPAAPTTLWTGLTHYWSMDEASGNSRIDSVGTDHLSETPFAVESAPGLIGNCATNVSAGNYLAGAALDQTTTWTVHCWIWPFDYDLSYFIINPDDYTSWAIRQDQNDSTTLETFAWDGTSFNQHFTSSAATNQWHRLAYGFNSSANEVWFKFNNETTVTNSTAGPIMAGVSTTLAMLTGTGALDEVGYWTRVLSEDDLSALWNGGAGTSYLSH